MDLKTGKVRGGNCGPSGRRRWAARALLAIGALLFFPGPGALAQLPTRDEVEAAYLYNFGKFVRWPAAAAQGPLTICVAAPASLRDALGRLVAGEQINGRPLEVKGLDRPESVAGCSILFVGSAEAGRMDAFLAAAAGKPVLTVGDGPDFLVRGGTIQFVLMEDHVRFSVNLNAANREGLSLSSELLKVAVSVTGQPQTGGPR